MNAGNEVTHCGRFSEPCVQRTAQLLLLITRVLPSGRAGGVQLHTCKRAPCFGSHRPFLFMSLMPHLPPAEIFPCLTTGKWLPSLWVSVRILLVASNKTLTSLGHVVKTFNMSWVVEVGGCQVG